MIPKPAQYLLRFDDLCPTIPRGRWQRFVDLIDKFGVRPIIAIVPDNRDPDLERAPADPGFWAAMRTAQAAGATIAVHGYQHLCYDRGASILGLHRRSEFAGVEYKSQREWIVDGFRILRDEGLNPRLWIAPRHGFDLNTLRALRDSGVKYISDGFARVLHQRDGVTWIPQQLWKPVAKQKGLWTICIHPYLAGPDVVEGLQSFLHNHAPQFTSFDRVVEEFPANRLGAWEGIRERIELWRVRRRRDRRRGKRRRS